MIRVIQEIFEFIAYTVLAEVYRRITTMHVTLRVVSADLDALVN